MELLVLIAALALAAPLFGGKVAESALSLDGIRIGMSYEEVLQIRGKPTSLNWEKRLTYFTYKSESNYSPAEVWFDEGKVVYCSGDELRRGKELVFAIGMPGSLLRERLGEAEDLNIFVQWFPSSGVVVSEDLLENSGRGQKIGLRDLNYPLEWHDFEPIDGLQGDTARRWASLEPWEDDYIENWAVQDLILGQSEKEVKASARDFDVIIESGYVRGIRNAKEAVFQAHLGYHPMGATFKLGEKPSRLPSYVNFPESPDLGRYNVATIQLDQGLVTSIDIYVKDDRLFRTLARVQDS